MGVMYGTKVYDISIDHCLYCGILHMYGYGMHICVSWVYIWWSWVYRYITAPS